MRTTSRTVLSAAAVLVASLFSPGLSHAAVGDLYAVTGAGGGSFCNGGTPSSLYELDPTDGAATLIAPVMIGATQARHVTGLAMHPATGVLYAVMNGQDTNGDDCSEATLLTIDPGTGAATIVGSQGSLPSSIPDITFDPFGTLYAWSEGLGDQLIVIDITDGTYGQVANQPFSTSRTGLGSDSRGRLYIKSGSTLDRINQYTAEWFDPLPLNRDAHNMLAFDAADVLYSGERNSDGFDLFTIDLETGITTTKGSNSITNIAALAFDRGVVVEPDVIDLSVSKSVDEAEPQLGTDVVFTLTVENHDLNRNAENVVVRDVLPSNFTYVSSTGDGTYDDATGEWTIQTVSLDSFVVIEITATATSAGEFVNSAEIIEADSYDPDSVYGSGDTSSDSYWEVTGTVLMPRLFSISRRDDLLWVVDPELVETDAAQQMSITGDDICGGNGLATQPGTGTLFAVVQSGDCSTRKLVTLDAESAEATEIGDFGNTLISAIAFGPDADTLYAASGNGGTSSRTLFTVDPTDASLTPRCVLPSSNYGRALAYDDTLIYAATMDCSSGCQLVIHVISALSFPADPADTCPTMASIETGLEREPTGMTILEVGGDHTTFLVSSFGDLHEVTISGGLTLDGHSFVGFLSHDSKGLAFALASPTVADLTVSKSAAKSRVKGAKFIEYLLQAQNNGPDSVDNVVLTDAIPFGTTLVSSSGACSDVGGVLTCDVGTLASGESRNFSMVVQVTCKKCSTVTNVVGIEADADFYESPYNNSWQIDTTIKGKF